jgi:hypothetical protein
LKLRPLKVCEASRVIIAVPLPTAEGPAELIVHVQSPKDARPSIYDAFGKAKEPRTAEDLDAQLEEERAAWDVPVWSKNWADA